MVFDGEPSIGMCTLESAVGLSVTLIFKLRM